MPEGVSVRELARLLEVPHAALESFLGKGPGGLGEDIRSDLVGLGTSCCKCVCMYTCHAACTLCRCRHDYVHEGTCASDGELKASSFLCTWTCGHSTRSLDSKTVLVY